MPVSIPGRPAKRTHDKHSTIGLQRIALSHLPELSLRSHTEKIFLKATLGLTNGYVSDWDPC